MYMRTLQTVIGLLSIEKPDGSGEKSGSGSDRLFFDLLLADSGLHLLSWLAEFA